MCWGSSRRWPWSVATCAVWIQTDPKKCLREARVDFDDIVYGLLFHTAADFALWWSGVKMKTARKLTTKTELVERHCAKLELSVARLHEVVSGL